MEPTPQDPLDRAVLPTSNNWLPNKKMPNLGYVGKPLHKPTITKKKFLVKLKGRKQPIDVVAQRQRARTRLMNAKAHYVDNLVRDSIELNDVEQRFLRRKRELERIENQFKAGVLAFFSQDVVKQAESQMVEEVVQNDPDVASFDQKTSEIVEKAQQLTELQKLNEQDALKVRDEIGELDVLLEDMIASVELADEMEQTAELVEQRNMLPLASIVEEEEDEEKLSDYTQDEDIEETIESNLEKEELKADRLEEVTAQTQELLTKAQERKPPQPKTQTLNEAKQLLTEIEKVVERLQESLIAPISNPRLRRLVNRVTTENPNRNLRKIHERNPRPTTLREFRDNLIKALREAREVVSFETVTAEPGSPGGSLRSLGSAVSGAGTLSPRSQGEGGVMRLTVEQTKRRRQLMERMEG